MAASVCNVFVVLLGIAGFLSIGCTIFAPTGNR